MAAHYIQDRVQTCELIFIIPFHLVNPLLLLLWFYMPEKNNHLNFLRKEKNAVIIDVSAGS